MIHRKTPIAAPVRTRVPEDNGAPNMCETKASTPTQKKAGPKVTNDTVQFYNNALAIIVGTGAGALSFRLLPPLSPITRTQRLLTLTLRDLRHLASRPFPESIDDWQRRTFARLVAMPTEAQPLQRAQLLTALSVGTEFIRLRRIAQGLSEHSDVNSAFEAFANGEIEVAALQFDALDRRIASSGDEKQMSSEVLRARSIILAITEALTQHASYFGAKTSVSTRSISLVCTSRRFR